ncbi:hypothetical protein QO014_003110 [Kaistia dalseonensis]|uniref:Uncharacterized protein n=1 Tax=Kaistia dalseonensis TaxID=410840 RepID=A0ABU0HAB9_9HYPH|nr:hypothetical protein [Kaistia dalseonensis]
MAVCSAPNSQVVMPSFIAGIYVLLPVVLR